MKKEFSNFIKKQFIFNSIIIFNIVGVFRDFSNYFYSRKNIKKFTEKTFWEVLKLRLDWFGMPYTVLNYEDEFFQEISETGQKHVILRDIAPLIREFNSFESYDIIQLKQKRLKGDASNSILIYFRPVFYFITLKNIIFTSILGYIIYLNIDKILLKFGSILNAIEKL